MRLVRPWPRLPREAVAAPSLAVFKARLDGALSNLVWWKMYLLMAGGLDQVIFKRLFQPKSICDSRILRWETKNTAMQNAAPQQLGEAEERCAEVGGG